MSSASFPALPSFADTRVRDTAEMDHALRLRELIESEHSFIWRAVRRLGVPMSDVDDAVQKVFLVAARRLPSVPLGRERAFLFATAMRIASNERRAGRRQRSAGPEPLETILSDAPSPEKVASDRALLDALLETLPIELRAVVVLYELEQLTAEEISELLDLPPGTVASRIRRARALLEAAMTRLGVRERNRT